MDLDNLAKTSGDPMAYNPSFRNNIESHLPWLLANSISTVISITSQQLLEFQGDFYGLLFSINIPKQYHYFVLRFNGFKAMSDFTTASTTLVMPDFTIFDQMLAVYKTKTLTI